MPVRVKKIQRIKDVPLTGLSYTKVERDSFYVYKVDYEKGDSLVGPFDSASRADQHIECKNIFSGCIFTGQQVLDQLMPPYTNYEKYVKDSQEED